MSMNWCSAKGQALPPNHPAAARLPAPTCPQNLTEHVQKAVSRLVRFMQRAVAGLAHLARTPRLSRRLVNRLAAAVARAVLENNDQPIVWRPEAWRVGDPRCIVPRLDRTTTASEAKGLQRLLDSLAALARRLRLALERVSGFWLDELRAASAAVDLLTSGGDEPAMNAALEQMEQLGASPRRLLDDLVPRTAAPQVGGRQQELLCLISASQPQGSHRHKQSTALILCCSIHVCRNPSRLSM